MESESARVLFQDDSIICAVKPCGVLSESSEGVGMPDILKNTVGGDVFCVHRLDRAVGGVMVFARSRAAAAYLSSEIANRRLEKEYLACCHGSCPDGGVMRDLLFKDSKSGKSYVVNSRRRGVREAVLSFEKISEKIFEKISKENSEEFSGKISEIPSQNFSENLSGEISEIPLQKISQKSSRETRVSLVKIKLETGRSHQIRVQFSSRKMPLVGDGRYGARDNCQIALWSCGLSFKMQSGATARFSSPPPSVYPWTLFDGEIQNLFI